MPALDTWDAAKELARHNGDNVMSSLDQGYAFYVAGTNRILAVLGPKAIGEVKPMIEEGEREIAGKEWDEGSKRWI
ncbi:hypothetical protein KCU77_g2295, partial [Aureobasidium melanogenum]